MFGKKDQWCKYTDQILQQTHTADNKIGRKSRLWITVEYDRKYTHFLLNIIISAETREPQVHRPLHTSNEKEKKRVKKIYIYRSHRRCCVLEPCTVSCLRNNRRRISCDFNAPRVKQSVSLCRGGSSCGKEFKIFWTLLETFGYFVQLILL